MEEFLNREEVYIVKDLKHWKLNFYFELGASHLINRVHWLWQQLPTWTLQEISFLGPFSEGFKGSKKTLKLRQIHNKNTQSSRS